MEPVIEECHIHCSVKKQELPNGKSRYYISIAPSGESTQEYRPGRYEADNINPNAPMQSALCINVSDVMLGEFYRLSSIAGV
jgi:hypothetical protein